VGAHLKAHGPFLGGDAPNAADAALAPKLYHAKHALKHFKARALSPRAPRARRWRASRPAPSARSGAPGASGAALQRPPAERCAGYGLRACRTQLAWLRARLAGMCSAFAARGDPQVLQSGLWQSGLLLGGQQGHRSQLLDTRSHCLGPVALYEVCHLLAPGRANSWQTTKMAPTGPRQWLRVCRSCCGAHCCPPRTTLDVLPLGSIILLVTFCS